MMGQTTSSRSPNRRRAARLSPHSAHGFRAWTTVACGVLDLGSVWITSRS
jgi:hypothetical protein